MTKRKANAPTAQAIISPAAASPWPKGHPLEAPPWRYEQREQAGQSGYRLLRMVDRVDTGMGGIHAITTMLRNQDAIAEANACKDDRAKHQLMLSPTMMSGLFDALEVLVGVCQEELDELRNRMIAGEGQ